MLEPCFALADSYVNARPSIAGNRAMPLVSFSNGCAYGGKFMRPSRSWKHESEPSSFACNSSSKWLAWVRGGHPSTLSEVLQQPHIAISGDREYRQVAAVWRGYTPSRVVDYRKALPPNDLAATL